MYGHSSAVCATSDQFENPQSLRFISFKLSNADAKTSTCASLGTTKRLQLETEKSTHYKSV